MMNNIYPTPENFRGKILVDVFINRQKSVTKAKLRWGPRMVREPS